MISKKYKIEAKNIRQLIKPIGGCMASDKITVFGEKINFMYRVDSDFDHDSGWRFMSGTEDQNFADNADNWAIYDVNTIANYDSAIIQYLDKPVGTELERVKGTERFRAAL